MFLSPKIGKLEIPYSWYIEDFFGVTTYAREEISLLDKFIKQKYCSTIWGSNYKIGRIGRAKRMPAILGKQK